MTKSYCDNCGKEVDSLVRVNLCIEQEDTKDTAYSMDLCDSCVTELGLVNPLAKDDLYGYMFPDTTKDDKKAIYQCAKRIMELCIESELGGLSDEEYNSGKN